MRLLSWLLWAAAAIVPVISSEERNITRPKRDSSEKKIVCYYTNWSVYRPGTAKFSPQNINPYLCTHLIYAFGGLSKENALKPFDKYQDIEQGGYAKFNGLKTYNKNLKTMLAIGGWNEGSARFSPLVADAERRKELVKNTVKFLRQNHFDGLDLDWEYPSFRDGGKPRDRDNYATLVQEFREEFERESEKTGRTRLLLTMAVPAGIEYIDKGYDVPKLNKYLDWMNILSYDYHSAFEPTINHHSPLFSLEEDDEYNFDAQLSIDYTVQHYIKLGAERSKLVLGIPTYGRSYTLFNPDATDIGSPADGPGEQGEATREKGYLAYYEICERVKSGGWSIENPNPEAMGPYAYKENQWVGYDDEVIARAKAKYVSDNDLGGIMFWSIDNDDFRGKCHGKPYPIIEAAKEALLASSNELVPTSIRSESSRSNSNKQDEDSSSRTKTRKTRIKTKSTTTTESSKNYSKSGGRTSTTPQPPTTPDPGSDFVCKDEGFFPHPRDCKKYFWCLDSGPSSLGIVAHQFTCPSGLVFNKISDSCDYARNVICKTKPETTKATTTTTTTSTTTQRTTTVRSRLIITASPPRALSTTTTTTEQPSKEEVKEDDAEDEEDPGTIKELINLIKRLGGVEQLEKQLNLQNSEEKEKIKPSLYSRVLQGRTANRYRGISEEPTTSKYVPVFRNRPVKPQSPNTDDSSSTARVSERPQYVTIQRNRPTKIISKEEKKVEEEEESEEEVEESDKSIRKDENPRPLRKRPNNDATTEKEYVTLRRARLQKEEKNSTPKYKNIVRVRSTTEATVEEEEEDDVEEEISEEEQDADEEEESEAEPDQKLKKYSAIIRENKKIETTEEESKVSGLQNPNYINGTPSPATISASEEKDNVNNVYTMTSSRYVELRRTHPSTAVTTEKYVNNVNNFKKNVRENVHVENDAKEESKREKDFNDKYFPRKITTETVKRLNSPSIKQSIIENTTPILEYSSKRNGEISRLNEYFLLRTTTGSVTIPNNKQKKTYKILNRKNIEPVFTDDSESNKPLKLNKDFQASTQTIPITDGTFNNGVTRRFQFAPRTKPTFLIPKQTETTTQAFTITVPDLPDSSLTENILGFSFRSQFPSATLEPATTIAPIETDTTPLNLTENKVFATINRKYFPSSTYSGIPTTSTLTSVVTSITESSYTERKKISLPKKARFSIGIEQGHNTLDTTREETFETTKPYFTPLARYTARNSETTSANRRRGNIQSTSTTTEKYEQLVTKFFPKKTRTVKKVVSTEVPEVTSSATRKFRFQSRSKLRDSESNSNKSNNLVFLQFGSDRKKKNSEKNEDDLEVEQTATFFGDNFEENDRYILSGGVSQTSEKAYLNASIFLVPNSLVEGKEGKSDVISDKVSSNTFDLYKIRNTAQRINKTDSTELVRNRSVSGNSSFRNLKVRTQRPTETEKERTAENKKKFFQTDNATSKINFKNVRTKVQQNINKPKEILTQEKKKFSESVTEKNIYNNDDVTPTIFKATSLRTNKHKTFVSDKKLNEKSDATDFEKVDINEPVRYYTPDPNLNFKSTKIKVLQTTESPNKEKTFTVDFYNNEDRNSSELENVNLVPTNFGNSRRKFPSGRTEGKVETPTQANYFQKLRGKTRQSNYNFTEVTTEGSTLKATSRSTKISSVYSSQSKRKFLKNGYERVLNEVETSTTPLNAIEVKSDIRNLNYETPKKLLTELQNENEEYATKFNDDKIVTLTTNPSDSTFGQKFGSVFGFVTDSLPVQSTVHSTAYTENENNLTRTIFNKVNPTISKLETSKIAVNENLETTTSTNTKFPQKGYSVINSELSTSSPSNLRNFRGRIRPKILSSTQVPEDSLNSVSGIIEPLTTTQSSLSSARFRNRGKIGATESLNLKIGKILNDSVESESSNGRTTLPNKRRKILVRARPVQPILEAKEKEEDNELESPEEPSKISKTSAAKGTQEYFNNIRTRGRSTTQSTITSDRSERRRTQLDRKRLRVETKTSTIRPESQTETTSSTSRSNYLLRRRTRPTTSSTTTEEPYVEQQEDSRLEESKSLDEIPEIQDLADPAVVAIHNLATVSPGPINPVVTPINTYSETPATYTVHVTPSDIASFTTPARISSVTPGSVYSRPTSILTLKPYTVPVITKQYLPKQTSVSLRTPSPFRGTGISIVSEEPFNPRSEILTQSRRQETTQKTIVAPSTSNFPQKEAAAKSRRLKPFSKLSKQVVQSVNSPEPPVDYEYYDENEDPLVNIPASALKVKVHSDGYIECLDRGNFPHPFSCKKFISCAKMENNELLGWEYTCPKHLSFDPVGGICNWSAGLGCQH